MSILYLLVFRDRIANTEIAIAEHQRLNDHNRLLQSHYNTAMADNEILRRELNALRMEGVQLRGDINSSSGHPPPPPPAAPHPGSYPSDPYASSTRPELPPIRSLNNGPDSMTGVQYDTPRANGYRQERY